MTQKDSETRGLKLKYNSLTQNFNTDVGGANVIFNNNFVDPNQFGNWALEVNIDSAEDQTTLDGITWGA